MLIPIDGAVYDPQTTTYEARGSLNVDGPTKDLALTGMSLNVEHLSRHLAGLTTGQPVANEALTGLQVGFSGAAQQTSGEAKMGLTVQGQPLVEALTGLIVYGEGYHRYPALMGLNLQTTRATAAAAVMGLNVRGERKDVARTAGTIRGERFDSARMALQIAAINAYAARTGFTVGGVVNGQALTGLEVRSGRPFFILVDVLSEDIIDTPPGASSPVGFYAMQQINAYLLVNGATVPIKSFTYQEPAGKLGAVLNVVLTIPNRAQVPLTGAIEFGLTVTKQDNSTIDIPLVQGGKIGGRDYNIRWKGTGPDDELTISALDLLDDKFGLAPRRPITMFDPSVVDIKDVRVKNRDAVLTEQGQPILPLLEPSAGLTMLQCLQRAYTGMSGLALMSALTNAQRTSLSAMSGYINQSDSGTIRGLGFGSIVTNIPNYAVARVDFSIEVSWHDAVQPLVGMFGAIYFVEGDRLFILDTLAPLPFAVNPRVIAFNRAQTVGYSTPQADPTNAVVLTYQEKDDAGQSVTVATEVEQHTDKQGDFGVIGYTETETTTYYERTYDEDGGLISEVLLHEDVETHVTVGSETGTTTILAHSETTQNFYSNGLKTGHDKRVNGIISTGPDASLELVEVLREKCTISWQEDPFVRGQKIQSSNFTQIDGLIYTTTDTQERIDPVSGQKTTTNIRYPAIAAQAAGVIEDDGKMNFGTLRTIKETLRPSGPNTLDVSVIDIDHLTNTVRPSRTQPRTGNAAINDLHNRARSILIRDLASEALIGPRVPASLNTGELPKTQAIPLAKRYLYRLVHPLDVSRFVLAGVDFSIRKGSTFRGQARDAGPVTTTSPYVVNGYGISGNNLGQQGHRIQMSLEAIQLPT